MVQQTKRAWLQCVLQDDVSGLVKIVNAKNGLTDLDCLIDKKYPLAEARSVEMLILLSHLKGNIYQQLPDGKRIFYQMRKNLISLLKEKKALSLAMSQDLKYQESLDIKIKKMKAVMCLFQNIINLAQKEKVFSLDDIYDPWTTPHLFNEIINGRYTFDIKGYNRILFDKSYQKDLAYCIFREYSYYYAQKVKLTQKGFENAGFSPKNIRINAKIINTSPWLKWRFLLDEKDSVRLVYRGTTQKNDPFLPLSHFGTKEAASYRLYCLNNSIFLETGFYEKVKQNNWVVFNQIHAAFLKMNRLLEIPDLLDHNKNAYASLVLHYCLAKKHGLSYLKKLYNIPIWEINKWGGGAKNEVLKEADALSLLQIEKLPKEFYFIFYQPQQMKIKDVEKELSLAGYYPIDKNEDENRENLTYQRMIRFFEKEGFEGFKYKNANEDTGKDSFIIFHPDQVVLSSVLNNNHFKKRENSNETELYQQEEAYLDRACKITLSTKEIRDLVYPYFYEPFERSALFVTPVCQSKPADARILATNQHQKS